MKKLIIIILVSTFQMGYSQDVNISIDELFGKSFIFEKVYSYAGCTNENTLSDKSVLRLKISIDSNGRVTGGYGSVPCLESGSTYGEILGFAHSNVAFVLWRSFEEGSTYTEPLTLIKMEDKMFVISYGDKMQVDDKFQDIDYYTKEELLQVSPTPKIY